MLKRGLVLYDALFAWCRDGQGENHNRPPQIYHWLVTRLLKSSSTPGLPVADHLPLARGVGSQKR